MALRLVFLTMDKPEEAMLTCKDFALLLREMGRQGYDTTEDDLKQFFDITEFYVYGLEHGRESKQAVQEAIAALRSAPQQNLREIERQLETTLGTETWSKLPAMQRRSLVDVEYFLPAATFPLAIRGALDLYLLVVEALLRHVMRNQKLEVGALVQELKKVLAERRRAATRSFWSMLWKRFGTPGNSIFTCVRESMLSPQEKIWSASAASCCQTTKILSCQSFSTVCPGSRLVAQILLHHPHRRERCRGYPLYRRLSPLY